MFPDLDINAFISLFIKLWDFLLVMGDSWQDELTHSGHGDHEEVDAVPVAQALLVGEVGGVPAVLKLKVISISADIIWR